MGPVFQGPTNLEGRALRAERAPRLVGDPLGRPREEPKLRLDLLACFVELVTLDVHDDRTQLGMPLGSVAELRELVDELRLATQSRALQREALLTVAREVNVAAPVLE